jgi:hypothetical protein
MQPPFLQFSLQSFVHPQVGSEATAVDVNVGASLLASKADVVHSYLGSQNSGQMQLPVVQDSWQSL